MKSSSAAVWVHRLVYWARSFSALADFRRLSAVPSFPIDRPIFLLGTQGGGLTLLSRMLRRHPAVVCAAGGSGYWTAADEIQNVYGIVLPAELTGLRFKAPPHPVLTAPRSWTYAADELIGAYRRTEVHANSVARQSLERVIRFCALRFAGDPYHFRFVDKSQVYTVRVGLIQALLKTCAPRFILVTREPYVSVYRAAEGGAADLRRLRSRLSLQERLELCAQHLGNSMRAVFDDCRRLNLELKVVPFERLLRNPEAVLRDVCEFVGLDFRQELLPAPDQSLPLGSRNLDRWFPLRIAVNERYERELDGRVVDAVNRHAADLVGDLGYEVRA